MLFIYYCDRRIRSQIMDLLLYARSCTAEGYYIIHIDRTSLIIPRNYLRITATNNLHINLYRFVPSRR